MPIPSHATCQVEVHPLLPPDELMRDYRYHMAVLVALGSMYMFTLHIENKASPGFLTEKFYQGFLSGSLPIYLGAAGEGSRAAPGEHSFIDVDEYYGAEQLAAYLHHLVATPTEYARTSLLPPLMPRGMPSQHLVATWPAEHAVGWLHLSETSLDTSLEDDTWHALLLAAFGATWHALLLAAFGATWQVRGLL